MKEIHIVFLDVGCTLVNEDAALWRQCHLQASTKEAREQGLTPEVIREGVRQATLAYRPQYRTVLQRYGLTQRIPYPHELETLYKGAEEVLRTLARQYRLGIIANQADGLAGRLEGWGIAHHFDLVVSSWDHQVMKPDPRLFQIAIEQSGLAAPQCLMVGDRLDNDVFPAKSLGMKTVWIRQGFGGQQQPRSTQDIPDATIDSLEGLLDLL